MEKMFNRVLIITGCLIALGLSGCAAPRRQGITVVSDQLFRLKPYSNEELIARISDANAVADTLRADTAMSIQSSWADQDKPFKCSGKLAVSVPGKLRLACTVPFGGTMMDITADGEKFYLYLPKEGIVYTGYQGDYLHSAGIPYNLTPEVILTALLPQPMEVLIAGKTVYYEYIGETFILYIVRSYGMQSYLEEKLTLDALTMRITQREIFSRDGIKVLDITVPEFLTGDDNKAFPKKMRVYHYMTQLQLEFVFQKVSMNIELNDALFTFTKPEHVKEVRVQ
ncbi:MAG: hypothetical protein AB1454_01370 [Candidatus Auribacterota bacterium]